MPKEMTAAAAMISVLPTSEVFTQPATPNAIPESTMNTVPRRSIIPEPFIFSRSGRAVLVRTAGAVSVSLTPSSPSETRLLFMKREISFTRIIGSANGSIIMNKQHNNVNSPIIIPPYRYH